jgi:hypothetical protein
MIRQSILKRWVRSTPQREVSNLRGPTVSATGQRGKRAWESLANDPTIALAQGLVRGHLEKPALRVVVAALRKPRDVVAEVPDGTDNKNRCHFLTGFRKQLLVRKAKHFPA